MIAVRLSDMCGATFCRVRYPAWYFADVELIPYLKPVLNKQPLNNL